MAPPTLTASCLALLLTPALFAQDSKPVQFQRDGQWFETDVTGRTWRVNPEVISVRWSSEVQNFDQLRARLQGVGHSLAGDVTQWTVLRTNRLGISDLRLAEGQDPVSAVAALEQLGWLQFATTNTFGEWVGTPNDTLYSNQWSKNNTGQTGGIPGADVNAEAAWDIETGDPSVIVAVLDSGTDINHPDLVDNRWVNPIETTNGIDDDGNGYIDDIFGWDFGNNNNDVVSGTSHGTWVAGVVAARTDNGLGVAGMAGGFGPDDGCTYLPCAVGDLFPDGSILDDAILYAADEGARVITMSLTVGASSAIDAAVDYASNTRGAFVNCASGNSGGTNNVGYPARLDDVIAVGSSNDRDNVSGFSSGGPQVYISAPGEGILTTSLGNSYATVDGTSFASPHIAAIAALLFSADPTLTNAEVAEILKDTAVDIGASGFDVRAGWGRVDAAAALEDFGDGCNIETYCTSVPNTTGFAARLYPFGSGSVAANDLTILANPCPANQNGLFFYSQGQQQTPFGPGFLCLQAPQVRLGVVQTDVFGDANLILDISNPPQSSGQISAGETWNFQFWYRDPAAGGAGFNTTDAVSVTFCP